MPLSLESSSEAGSGEAQEPIRLLIIADRSPLVGEALAQVLRRQRGIELMRRREAISPVPPARPTLALVDATADLSGALLAVRNLHRGSPEIRPVVIGLEDRPQAILQFIEAGAVGYVPREGGIGDLLRTVRAVARGETVCSGPIARSLFARISELARQRPRRHAPETALTARERDVLLCLAEGLSNKEIARRLGIALYTAKNHLQSLYKKLGAHRRREAVCAACELGLLTPGPPR